MHILKTNHSHNIYWPDIIITIFNVYLTCQSGIGVETVQCDQCDILTITAFTNGFAGIINLIFVLVYIYMLM